MPQSTSPSTSVVQKKTTEKVYGKKPSVFVKERQRTPDELALRERLNVVPNSQFIDYREGVQVHPDPIPMVGALPSFPRAPNFRPNTDVIGSSTFANQHEDLMRLAPQLRGRVPQVLQGWNSDFINSIARDMRSGRTTDDALDKFYGLTLRGTTSPQTKRIAVSPFVGFGKTLEYDPLDAADTLSHEYGHVVGNHGLENIWDPGESENEAQVIGRMGGKAAWPFINKYNKVNKPKSK